MSLFKARVSNAENNSCLFHKGNSSSFDNSFVQFDKLAPLALINIAGEFSFRWSSTAYARPRVFPVPGLPKTIVDTIDDNLF